MVYIAHVGSRNVAQLVLRSEIRLLLIQEKKSQTPKNHPPPQMSLRMVEDAKAEDDFCRRRLFYWMKVHVHGSKSEVGSGDVRIYDTFSTPFGTHRYLCCFGPNFLSSRSRTKFLVSRIMYSSRSLHFFEKSLNFGIFGYPTKAHKPLVSNGNTYKR